MATREDEAALGARRRLDRGHRGPWILTVADDIAERPRQALARRLVQEPATGPEVHSRDRLVAAVLCEQGGDEDNQRRGSERSGEEEPGGPPGRAARVVFLLTYLISNFALPVVWLPAMSVASQRNSVVVLTTNDWPGSRGPVDSQSVEVLSGFEPSVV